MASSSLAIGSVEGEATMKQTAEKSRKTPKQTTTRERISQTAKERQRVSHANGARRRRGARESVKGKARGEAPRINLERGINLDVLGRAIMAQADERIRWHKRTADAMEAELKAMPMKPGAPASTVEDWKQLSRRTDLQGKIDGHREYARFLDFVRRNIVRDRRYRLGLSDMSLLEIMPKGTYW